MKHAGLITLALLALSLSQPLSLAQQGEWPQWRGSDRANVSRETGLRKEWPTNGPPLLWRVTGIGDGITPVSVAGGRVFTVGNIEGREFVFAFDAKTGENLWRVNVGVVVREWPLMRLLTQRSPALDGDRVYTFSAEGNLYCLDAAVGKVLWRRNYPSDFGTRPHPWGYCDRPMVDGARLICTPFGTNTFITALDKITGEPVWRTKVENPPVAGHASVVLSEAGGVRQYVVFHRNGLSGFAADDGRHLWDAKRAVQYSSSYTPGIRGEFVYSPNGYGGGLAALRLRRDQQTFAAEWIYQQKYAFETFQDTPAYVGDTMYAVERNRLAALDLKTGDRLWPTNASIEVGRAALTFAEGHLYVVSVKGEASLVQITDSEPKEVSRFSIPDHQPSIGVTAPIIAGKRLYLRNSTNLFCYNISPGNTDSAEAPRKVTVTLTNAELAAEAGPPRVGVNRAPDAVFIPTPHDVVARMLTEGGVTKDTVVVDLGSGDGRIPIAAAKRYGCNAIGYEIDERLVEISRQAVANETLQARVKIEHADVFMVDLASADVVTLFLYPRLMERLIPQLEKLKPGSRIISHQFDMPGFKPDRTIVMESAESGATHRILIWTTPLRRAK